MRAKLLAFAMLTLAACAASESSDDIGVADQEIGLRRGAIDNAGVVESGTMMLADTAIDPVQDTYNVEDPFAVTRGRFFELMKTRLTNFDAWDGETDWTPEQATTWVERMSTSNYLVVDTSKPCAWDTPTYLEIERAQLTGREHATCGGRLPNEDAFDVTATFLVKGPGASPEDGNIGDGVDSATKPSTETFPFLAEMNDLF